MKALEAALADRYRIERELGRGGMATVYLAYDLRHDRKVALKVLKPELAAVLGAERFVVEIKTTAALQHPHILPLFDSGTADGFLFYVMPFIDGETLRAKLDRETQFGIDEAVRIATSVGDALGYAHKQGVIHRDIKPENILLHDGRPMVADFGIALALSAAAGGRMTETGMSLGTPHYMSPEQATADKELTGRSDIYSLGSVLYEMLAGQPPHLGGSAQQIIMKIVTEDAQPLTKLRRAVPAHVAAAVARSLEKLPADRFATAGEFTSALANPAFRHGDAAATGPRTAAHGPRWRDPLTAGLAAAAIIAAGAAAWAFSRATPAAPVGWYALALDSSSTLAYRGTGEPPRLALTPDGRTLVYVGNVNGAYAETNRLFVRPLGSLETRVLSGTQGATRPAVSPDGSTVAFLAGPDGQTLFAAPLGGGPVIMLADSSVNSGPAWGPGGFVHYLSGARTIRRVPGTGGASELVATLPPAPDGGDYASLTILPGGHGGLVGVRQARGADQSQFTLRAVNLSTGQLGATFPALAARYVPESKALVYVALDGALMAVPFDLGSLRPEGRPVALLSGVSFRSGETDLDIAAGTLTYALQGRNGTEYMAWVTRAGGAIQALDSTWDDTEFESYALSPDGRQLAITIGGTTASSASNQSRYDVWLKQLDRGPLSRLTFKGEENGDPAWSGDGRYVSYASRRNGRRSLWRRRADGVGEEEKVADPGRDVVESRWSRDGTWLVVSVLGPPSADIMAMHIGVDSVLRPLLAEPQSEWEPDLSNDGKWLAYVSNETGKPQVFVRPFPNVQEGKWQVSLNGGTDPVWSADGRELLFRSLDGNEMFASDMSKGPGLATRRSVTHAHAPSHFELNAGDRMFQVSADGSRFLFSVAALTDVSGALVIMQNFGARLRAALAAAK
ncbi:MAG TPA: protein kinase [Dactylosporangium sp.]|nr:protein kinase [Dactylosporangium sp.]